jgi:uncharacterized protein YndB with AHSA1/START domain
MINVTDLPHCLDRTIDIRAQRATVFRFFTDPARWATWWGAGSTIDPRVDGAVFIRYPEGTEAAGSVVEMVPPERIVFSFGFVKGTPVAVGGSLVTIRLEDRGNATRLHLSHAFADPAIRDEFVQGWRYQLSLFANAISNDLHADAQTSVDRWFAAWSDPDAATRDAALTALAADGIRMSDRFSAIAGLEDLIEHVAASRRFMPGVRLEREGHVRQCQGLVLSDWIARSADGRQLATGTNVFDLNGDGKIESVTGFWEAGR